MSADPDDDALSWGDTDPTMVGAQPATTPAAAKVIPTPASEASVTPPAESAANPVVLVLLGILAGAYLLYTVGWVITVQRSPVLLPGVFDQVMGAVRQWSAVAGPALWFAATLVLTRRRRAVIRLGWLVLGLAMLVPLPFVVGV